MIRLMITTILTMILSGCGGIDVSQYANNTPRFDLYEYFKGATTGWGIVLDRNGRMTRQFVVTIDGRVNAGIELIMEEHFSWSNGEKSERIWRINRGNDNSYVGRAADVIGKAGGLSFGNALHWTYVLALEEEGTTWHIDFDDWMFLQPDNVLINRTSMSKFGLHIGEVIITFRKES
jgi:hypothetical protein